jgi:hypothetical protein
LEVTVKVPEDVTGLFVTVKMAGIAKSTDVTVPVPPVALRVIEPPKATVPPPERPTPAVTVTELLVRERLVDPPRETRPPPDSPAPAVTVKLEVASLELGMALGRSLMTIALKVGTAATPVTGPE